MDNESLKQRYDYAIQVWENTYGYEWRKNNHEKAKQLDLILQRSFWYCTDNPHGHILLSMLNPSVGEGDPKPIPLRRIMDLYNPNSKNDFWRPWMENLKEYIYADKVAHIDLFPIRESDQNYFEYIVPIELKAELLRVTQKEIEQIHPKLIIHANKSTGYYYGTIPKYPWMGYELQRVHDSVLDAKGNLYIITGLLNDEKRVSYSDTDNRSKIIGSYLYVCYQQTGIHVQSRPELLINKKDIDILINKYSNLT